MSAWEDTDRASAASQQQTRFAFTQNNPELKHPRNNNRKRDLWDAAYDQGHVKKFKSAKVEVFGGPVSKNPFQRAAVQQQQQRHAHTQ